MQKSSESEQPLESIPDNEDLFDDLQTEQEQSPLLDKLLWLQEHPLDLNSAAEEDLEQIPGVHPLDAIRIVQFRMTIGRYRSVSQVKNVEGIDENTFRRLSPYVTVDRDHRPTSVPAHHVLLRNRATHDLQPRSGFLDGTFGGSALKSYSRLTVLGSAQWQAGALFEKDPGERFRDGFASGYVAFNTSSSFSTIVLGDFVFDAGQGLTMSSGVGHGKGSEAVTVAKRADSGVQPYHSTDESHFLRGAAAGVTLPLGTGKLHLTGAVSGRSLAASQVGQDSISAFYDAGLYRTQSELDKRNAIREHLYAGRIHYSIPNAWSVGVTYHQSRFDKTIVAERTFEFSGSSESAMGIDATAQMGNFTLFGEIARSGGDAGVVGGILALPGQSTLALVFREYSPRFNNFRALGFGENGTTHNERGLYLGAELGITRSIRISGYIDHFKFPWRTFSNPVPVSGNDILLQADSELSSLLRFSARYSRKVVEDSEPATDTFGRQTSEVVNRDQRRVRLTATYQVSRTLSMIGRLEATRISYALTPRAERGTLFYQDLQYTMGSNVIVDARLVYFDTDSFDSRLYEVENEIRGVFSNPALYGKGRRWYLLVQCRLADHVSLSVRYAETRKEGVSSMGSGTSEIMGDIDNRLSLQLDVEL